MNKGKLGTVAASLAKGIAASALALVIGSALSMCLLLMNSKHNARFDTSVFLRQANLSIIVATLGCGLVAFWVSLKNKNKNK